MVKVFYFEHFWPRIPMVKVFVFSLSFLAKDTNGGTLLGLGNFWPRLLLLATLAMNTSDESYVCD